MNILKQTLEQLSKLIIGALTFVSALAWNEAFKKYFKNNDYLKSYGLWVYAIVTTLVAVISIILINLVTKRFSNIYTIICFIIIIIFIMYLYNLVNMIILENK